jgi:hypothetical protein
MDLNDYVLSKFVLRKFSILIKEFILRQCSTVVVQLIRNQQVVSSNLIIGLYV